MTEDRTLKRRVRERMAKTGETYTAARRRVVDKRDRIQASRSRLADTADRPSDASIRGATGKRWDTWFGHLDRWGAKDRTHAETARFLTDEHGVPGWWAQTITVWYQRTRGMRLKHQQRDGFTVYASKTIAVPIESLEEAFTDARKRRRWLSDVALRLRTRQPGRTARFDANDGTRVTVSIEGKGPAKTSVAVAHERLPDPDAAETAKAAWRDRLATLKSVLEA